VAFIPGVTGRLYNQFALTSDFGGISAFNSLTLSPALSAHFCGTGAGQFRAVPLVQCRSIALARLRKIGAGVIGWRWASCSILAFFGATYFLSQAHPSSFLRSRIRLFLVVIQFQTGFLQRTDAVAEKGGVSGKYPRVDIVDRSASHFLTMRPVQLGGRVRDSQAMESDRLQWPHGSCRRPHEASHGSEAFVLSLIRRQFQSCTYSGFSSGEDLTGRGSLL